MARWTKEEEKKLEDIYYQHELKELANIFGRTEGSVRNKHAMLKNKAPKKIKVELDRCPECNKRINQIPGEGYYCIHCFKEYNQYGEFMPPISCS